MKTIFVSLNILPETKRYLLGFVLMEGYNFRRIEALNNGKSEDMLVIETGTKSEGKALNAFLKQAKVSVAFVVEKGNKVGIGGKKLGTFKEVTGQIDTCYFDKSTGKKFVVEV